MSASETLTSLSTLFTEILGDVPPEFEGLLYLFFVLFLFYVMDAFFRLLFSLFRGGRL